MSTKYLNHINEQYFLLVIVKDFFFFFRERETAGKDNVASLTWRYCLSVFLRIADPLLYSLFVSLLIS